MEKTTLATCKERESSYSAYGRAQRSGDWISAYERKGVYLVGRSTGIVIGYASSRAKMLNDCEVEVFEEFEVLTARQYEKKWGSEQ